MGKTKRLTLAIGHWPCHPSNLNLDTWRSDHWLPPLLRGATGTILTDRMGDIGLAPHPIHPSIRSAKSRTLYAQRPRCPPARD